MNVSTADAIALPHGCANKIFEPHLRLVFGALLFDKPQSDEITSPSISTQKEQCAAARFRL